MNARGDFSCRVLSSIPPAETDYPWDLKPDIVNLKSEANSLLLPELFPCARPSSTGRAERATWAASRSRTSWPRVLTPTPRTGRAAPR